MTRVSQSVANAYFWSLEVGRRGRCRCGCKADADADAGADATGRLGRKRRGEADKAEMQKQTH